jgi:hypothetical protein
LSMAQGLGNLGNNPQKISSTNINYEATVPYRKLSYR